MTDTDIISRAQFIIDNIIRDMFLIGREKYISQLLEAVAEEAERVADEYRERGH